MELDFVENVAVCRENKYLSQQRIIYYCPKNMINIITKQTFQHIFSIKNQM